MKANNSIIMIGKKFHFLNVIRETDRLNPKRPRYICSCDCGKLTTVEGRHLRNGAIKSCGCFSKKRLGESSKTHGKTDTPEYKVWCGIKRRCLNKNDKRYPEYGGRGIKICEQWETSFETFLTDIGNRPGDDFSIERIDVNGNYQKDNCKWIKLSEQAKNRRTNVVLSLNGETMILSDWALKTGINPGTIKARINNGWSVHDALMLPLRYPKKTQLVPS